jgi:hypothetical protein
MAVEVLLLASKRLFTKLDFQRNEGLEAARSSPYDEQFSPTSTTQS